MRQLVAKWPTACAECSRPIAAGEQALWSPPTRRWRCLDCARVAVGDWWKLREKEPEP
jgi:hypothetical protein